MRFFSTRLVRTGALSVTTAVVDALLAGLDLLRTMKENLAGFRGSTVDITGTVAQLEVAAERQTSLSPESPVVDAA